jgi:hypothetical protein
MGEGGRVKESDGRVNSSIIYFIYYKNFCKCHNTPLPSTTINKKKKGKGDKHKRN